ncbi:MAG: PIG-L family deacetylase [Gemmatimonadaceae bacterium]
MTHARTLCALLLLAPSLLPAQGSKAPDSKPPDDRFKADLLLIVAHPDDEAAVYPYLAKAVFDDHKRVAVVFATDGGGGGNAVAAERGSALGAVRQIEVRRALGAIGIENLWFLGNRDVATHDVLTTLGSWNHGQTVADMVRLIRLTRPDVILTWLPARVAGENHGGHQASGVIATEAFDVAGDPSAFPEQVAAPAHVYERALESLRPWQPKKIYYFSDAGHADFMVGKGPHYPVADISPSHGVPYLDFLSLDLYPHATQGYVQVADEMKKGKTIQPPKDWLYEDTGTLDTYLILGKSLVGADSTADVFSGVSTGGLSFRAHRGYEVPTPDGLTLRPGGSWAFYETFARAHNLNRVATLLPPELEVSGGTPFHVPLMIRNGTGSAHDVALSVVLPRGWSDETGYATYSVLGQNYRDIVAVVNAPHVTKPVWEELTFRATSEGMAVSSVTIRVHLLPHKGIQEFEQ